MIEKAFNTDTKRNGTELIISVTGRIDTDNSSGLLAAYLNEQKNAPFDKLTIDLSQTEYISSAGLRVLLRMYKETNDKDNFSITGANELVTEVFRTTGFADFFKL